MQSAMLALWSPSSECIIIAHLLFPVPMFYAAAVRTCLCVDSLIEKVCWDYIASVVRDARCGQYMTLL